MIVLGSTFDTTNLKKRLYKKGIKKPICDLCGQDENWNGMKISMIMDHINGINNDHRLENLRIVCPNCDSGLSTFSGKNNKKVNLAQIFFELFVFIWQKEKITMITINKKHDIM